MTFLYYVQFDFIFKLSEILGEKYICLTHLNHSHLKYPMEIIDELN